MSSNPGEFRSEEEIQRLLAARRQEREEALGLVEITKPHFTRPAETDFTKDQRATTTLLIGGFTWKHERLIQGAFEGLGYKIEMLPVPNVSAFQIGKEYGNNGQCSPTYFTVGNLVQHLQTLERQGLSKEEIIDRYAFLTAGACGPCRFGMYEAEYRLALRNSGFDGFRVLLFQQKGGMNQSSSEAGLNMNLDFFIGMLNGIIIGDLLNDIAYQIRPYEMQVGETDRVLNEAVAEIYDVFRQRRTVECGGKLGDFLERFPTTKDRLSQLYKWVDHLNDKQYLAALERVAKKFGAIKVDRTNPKPIVKITGEFWAQTTEGDGNFNMFSFLEREGAQVLVEPIGTWLMYMLHQAKQKNRDRAGYQEKFAGKRRLPVIGGLMSALESHVYSKKQLAILSLAEKLFTGIWNKLRKPLNNMPHQLTDQYEMQRIGHPYYNSRAGGGEGHLEIAKNIYYSNKSLCHMVLSVKPFGCMPSTQSDGVQSAVVNHYKDLIYLPIETSGEGEINAHSRVQMALGEARKKMKDEFERTLSQCKHSLAEIRAYVAARPELQSGMYHPKHHEGIVSVAANFVKEVDELMTKTIH